MSRERSAREGYRLKVAANITARGSRHLIEQVRRLSHEYSVAFRQYIDLSATVSQIRMKAIVAEREVIGALAILGNKVPIVWEGFADRRAHLIADHHVYLAKCDRMLIGLKGAVNAKLRDLEEEREHLSRSRLQMQIIEAKVAAQKRQTVQRREAFYDRCEADRLVCGNASSRDSEGGDDGYTN